MELGQQSNLGTLISAVLVGLLAIGSNEFARMDRSALKGFVDNLHGRARAASQLPKKDPAKLNVEMAEKRIRGIETELTRAFDLWKKGQLKPSDRRFNKIWRAIHELQTQLASDAELRGALPAQAHIDYVWMLFRAAEMKPSEFSQAFMEECGVMLDHTDNQVRTQAAVLSIYHGYDPRQPREDELTGKLEEFARANSDNMIGVFLYLLISRELYEAGQREMAERLLRNGIRVYQDFPENIGRLKLLNELMDQRMNS
jgi:hypothetical protein